MYCLSPCIWCIIMHYETYMLLPAMQTLFNINVAEGGGGGSAGLLSAPGGFLQCEY